MRDQATELRKLVMRSMQQAAASASDAPKLLVLSGGKGGVGTTTMAVNLSVAMALNGSRVVLVDADLSGGDVASLCGLTDQANVTDVLAARRDIHEVIQPGPAGVQVIPGLWSPNGTTPMTPARQDRLIEQLRSLRRHADVVVVDAGNGSSEIARRFWRAADSVIMTTTADSVAIMDSYATIKSMNGEGMVPIQLIVNRVGGEEEGADVFRRVSESCRRFIQLDIGWLGSVHADPSIPHATSTNQPLLIHKPDSQPARQFQQIATAITSSMDEASLTRHDKAA